MPSIRQVLSKKQCCILPYSFCMGITIASVYFKVALVKEENITFPICNLSEYHQAGCSKHYKTSCLKQPKALGVEAGETCLFLIHQIKENFWQGLKHYLCYSCFLNEPKCVQFQHRPWMSFSPLLLSLYPAVYHGQTHGECLKSYYYVSIRVQTKLRGKSVQRILNCVEEISYQIQLLFLH